MASCYGCGEKDGCSCPEPCEECESLRAQLIEAREVIEDFHEHGLRARAYLEKYPK